MKMSQILTGHRGYTVGRLWVLQVRLEVGNRVICKGCVHEVGAPGVLEESRFHDEGKAEKKKKKKSGVSEYGGRALALQLEVVDDRQNKLTLKYAGIL